MLFDSIPYALFLPIVFILYWLVFKTRKAQNVLLLAASCFFYSCWDWRFLFLLAFSTLLNYFAGLKIDENTEKRKKKAYVITATIINVGLLGFFKYYNFFVGSLSDLITAFGFTPHISTLQIILSVGISFYTFHGLSYIFDIYYGKIKPTKSIVDYSLFVSFFTLLVAGPIERAAHLLPQIKKERKFDREKAFDGMKQILWGLFKKMVIADNCAIYANQIFNNSEVYGGSTLLLGAFYFTIQIYCDFSGYTDIALGSSRLLGFELLKNFNYPYFSRNIAEFWRRWHISLSSWFRDYLYIPLGGSRSGLPKQIRNTFIIFLVSGFWHGANWTFIVWGGLHALFIIPSIVVKTNRKTLGTVASGKMLPTLKEAGQMLLTFTLALFAWIVFRAENLGHAIGYIKEIFSASLFSMPEAYSRAPFIFIALMLIVEWFAREKNHALENLGCRWPAALRWGFYYLLVILIFFFTPEEQQQFIYFQF